MNEQETRRYAMFGRVETFGKNNAADFKVRNGSRKWVHRRVSRTFLPAPILKRKKRGFATNVVDGWFQSSVSGKFAELLLDPRSMMFTLLRPEPVHRLLEAHQSKRQDNHKLLFSLALFEQWLRSSVA